VITVIDYGAGNVRSVVKALEAVGACVTVTNEPAEVLTADRVVLPGVGAFGDCMASLRRHGLVEAVQQMVHRGRPFLGICVGMQVLFEEGEEMGLHAGLGVFRGRVVRFPEQLGARGLKIPHTGWNQIQPLQLCPLLAGLPPDAWVYFNHAYYCEASADHTAAFTQHGMPFASVVQRARVFGLQFHPEKSQQVGLRVLSNLVEAR
jgi:glutamine amidotransferase